jgi:hypothetical protein
MINSIIVKNIISLYIEGIKIAITPTIDYYNKRISERDKEVDLLYKELINQ